MQPEVVVLVGTAATLGITHTALGLDHTVPFILLGRARAWSLSKTLSITTLCGLAHVLSSVVVGMLGVTVAVALSSLAWFEALRGYWVAWALVGFGLWYAVTALVELKYQTPHRHVHVGPEGKIHRHRHRHKALASGNLPHLAPTVDTAGRESVLRGNRWAASLFVVFLLGPCEALLPLMTAPSLRGAVGSSLLVAAVFGAATLSTMLTLVATGWMGLRAAWMPRLERHLNWSSGLAIASSGLAILLLGV